MRSATTALLAATLLSLGAARTGAQWLQAETEHFTFVFEARDRAAVDELLSFSEEVYAKVTDFFRSYPRKIAVVVRGRLDYANGATAPFPMRLELIVTSPAWPWEGTRERDWLRLLLTHELTHYVHVTMDRGMFHALSRLFGQDAAWGSFAFLPGWLIEGPAINAETLFTTGGRGRNVFFEVLSQAPAMEGRLFSLEQAGYDSAFPPSGRVWLAGYVLVHYLLEKYGEDAFTRIMDDYLRFPFFGPWGAIRRVTGKSADDIFADLKAQMAERYQSNFAVPSSTLASPERIGSWYHPVATEAGLYVYRSDLNHAPAIVRYDPVTESDRVLVTGRLTDPSSFSATRDGLAVYYTNLTYDFRPSDGEYAASDLWALDMRTGRNRRITRGAHLWHPAVSEDGARLLAVQGSGSYSRLVEINTASGAIRAVFSAAEGAVYNPVISPDGLRIAFALNVRGFQDVYVMDLAEALRAAVPLEDPRASVVDVNRTLARPVLGPDAFGEYFPRWSGNSVLLFSSDRSGALSLYEADLASGAVTLVQQDPVAAYEGIVRDGQLLYASYSSNGWCLKSSTAPEAGSRALVPNDAAGSYPPPLPTAGSAAVVATGYEDRPRVYLWSPTVTLGSGLPSGLDLGFGAAILAGSLVGTSAWSTEVAWHPLTAQPDAQFSGTLSLGPARLNASFLEGYSFSPGAPGAFVLDSQASLAAAVPLWTWSRGDQGSSATVSAGVIRLSQLASGAPFTLLDALNAPPAQWAQGILLDAGAGCDWARSGAPLDFYLPARVAFSFSSLFQLPVLNGSYGARYTLLAEAQGRTFAHHVLRAGIKAAYGTDALDLASEPFVVPRGLFDPPQHALAGRGLFSLDYLAPIALLDQPLFLGLALLGVSAGAHVELLADWSFATPSLVIGDFVYFGAELSLLLGDGPASAPLTLGIAARFDAMHGWGFDLAQDLRPYVSLSWDTFGSGTAGVGGLASRVRR